MAVPGDGQEPVVWSSSPRSFARRSLTRNTATAASVATAPVASNTTTIIDRCRRSRAGDRGVQRRRSRRPRSCRRERAPGGCPRSTSVSGVTQPDRLDRRRQHAQREHDARDQEQGAGRRLRVGPRLLARLDADRGEQEADREDRADAEPPSTTTSSGQSIRPGSNGTPRTSTPTASVIAAPIAPTADPSDAASEDHGQEVARADVDVLAASGSARGRRGSIQARPLTPARTNDQSALPTTTNAR